MRIASTCAVAVATALAAGCSGDSGVGKGTYPAELYLGVGQRESSHAMDECTSTSLGAYVRFEGDDPQTADYASRVQFVSSDPTTVFVGDGVTASPDGTVQAAGTLIALKRGLATISAHYLDFDATIVVQVSELAGLRIEPALTDIAEDLPQKFKLIASFSDQRPEEDASEIAAWRFDPGTARAAVDPGGEVKANTARDDKAITLVARLSECGREAQTSFRVSPIASLSLDYQFPRDDRLPLHTSEALKVYANFAAEGSTRQNISRSATLENVPDDYVVATVETNHPPTTLDEAANPVDIGDDLVLVSALDDVREDVAFDVHVDSGDGVDMRTRTWSLIDTTVETLTISPGDINIRYPDRRSVTAIGTFSNGMQRDISRSVAWTSFDPTIAAVSNEVDDAGLIATADVDQDTEVEATLDQDGTVLSDVAVVHIFSSGSSTPSSDP